MKQGNPLRQRTIEFTVAVLRLAHTHVGDKALSPVLNQVVRSSGSIGANLTEAHGANTKAGFVNYFHIALQTARETKYWLEVLSAYGLKETDAIEKLHDEVEEFIKIITASLKTMRKRT